MAAAKVGSVCATVLAASAVCIVAAEPAHAQYYRSWPQFTPSWRYYHAPFRHTYRPYLPRQTKPRLSKTAPAPAQAAPKGPLQIIVSIADQRISVYDEGVLIARAPVSTGVPDHPTPRGVFSVLSKHRWHRSNLYSDAPMPYMQRLTWSGIALHEGKLPGYPASHGCIRLPQDFAVRLWQLTRRGTRVIITRDDVRPVEIANANLFAATPKLASAPPQPAAVIADDATSGLATVHRLAAAPDDAQQIIGAPVPGAAPAPSAARKPVPVSVFVSRKAGKLFVRHGYKPLFEAPVTIRNPEEPLGTHVFTVTGAGGAAGAERRWTVVSIPEGPPPAAERPARRQRSSAKKIMMETAPPDSSPDKANAALGRIEMPLDAVERIAGLLTPGSSLIVSDHGISRETGFDTDFIVETR